MTTKKAETANGGSMYGVRVYWINSGGSVGTDIAIRFTKDRVEFADGGWNPLYCTFLTATQARRAQRISEPVPKLRKAAKAVVILLDKAQEKLADAIAEDE